MPEQPHNAEPTPATPIGGMQDWQLHIQCALCRRHVVLPLDSIAERFSPRLRIIEVVRRLRCVGFRGGRRCGAAPKRVTLVKVATYGKSMRKVREIAVLEPSRAP